MDKLRSIQIFICVADHQGFAAAARHLNMSPPAVTRAISMLEDHLGTRLFVRTTRSVGLTESGKRFLEDSRRILLELAEAEGAAVGSHATPRGELRITAPVLFGRMFVTPILSDFLNSYPEVNARTLFVDRVVNLIDEGLDVAVRIGDLPASSLMAVRCGAVRQVMVGSPDYIKKWGLPRRPEDLPDHHLIQSTAITTSNEWTFQKGGQSTSMRIKPRVQMNTNDAVIGMVLQGFGVSRLLSYQVMSHLKEGRLQAILSDYEPPALPIHIVHQEGRMVSAKVRAFVDFMAARLRGNSNLI